MQGLSRWSIRIFVVIVCALTITLRITAQDMPKFPPTEDFYVEAKVDNPTPYLGQQIVYTFRFYAAEVPEFIYTAPDFNGLWRAGQLTTRYPELVGGRQYVVTASDILLYPTRAGVLDIQPSTLVIPESVFSDRPRIELQTPLVTLLVKSLPAGAPEGFNGAVGRLDMQIALDLQTVKLGEPVTLRQRISGSGNLEQIAPPRLSVPDGWRVYPDPSNLRVQNAPDNIANIVGERTFEWRLIPERAGSHQFPAISFSYFDPQAEEYRTISAEPFTIDVLPGADGLRELPTFRRGSNLPILPLKPVPTLLSVNPPTPSGGFWLLWLIPPLIVGLIWGGIQFNAYRERQRILRRQSGALRAARKRLESASSAGGVKGHTLVYQAIIRYFADKLDKSTLLPHEIFAVLPEYGVDEDLAERVRGCLNRAEEGRYAPEGLLDVLPLIAHTAETLVAVDKAWTIPQESQETPVRVEPVLTVLIVAALLIGVNVTPARAQLTAAEAVAQAETAYLAGDYAGAISLYEKLLEFDLRGAEIYANLGSAYFQEGDLGRALVHFRRAQALIPRDADVSRGLALVRALRVDIQGDETALIDNLAGFTAGVLTANELGWLAFGVWAIWCVVALIWILRPVWRKTLRAVLIGWGVVVIFGVILLIGRLYVEAQRPAAVVTAFLAPVMSGPGDDYLEIFDLYSAAEMRVMEIQGEWVRFLLPDGRQGWIKLSAVEII